VLSISTPIHPGAIDDDAHRRRRRRAAPRRDPYDASSHRTPSRASTASSNEDDARVDPSTRPSPHASPRARARSRPRARVAFDGWMRAPTRARRRPSRRRLGTRAREIRRIPRARPFVVAPFVVTAIARAVVHALDRPSPFDRPAIRGARVRTLCSSRAVVAFARATTTALAPRLELVVFTARAERACVVIARVVANMSFEQRSVSADAREGEARRGFGGG
jgi:hypothetical protein